MSFLTKPKFAEENSLGLKHKEKTEWTIVNIFVQRIFHTSEAKSQKNNLEKY